MNTATIKRWSFIHKWTSLVCTLFMLLLCVTGLPLIFHHEIDRMLGNEIGAPAMPADTPRASTDRLAAAAYAQRPDDAIQYIVWEEDEPDTVRIIMAATPATDPNQSHTLVLDARTATVLGEPLISDTFIYTMRRLHVDMFTNLWGELFLGLMGLVFAASIVSGIVVYSPFMRRLDFGTVRKHRKTRTKWLDLHNLTGIVTLTWAIVVGLTGTINTLAMPIIGYWQTHELSSMVAPYAGKPLPARQDMGSLDRTLEVARKAAPDMNVHFIAMPGTAFSSPHHHAVFMNGNTAVTSRLLKPILVDALTIQLSDSRDPPWYMNALLISQPLHFGDYGGMPLQWLWAILDIVTIIVLGSGLYLWLSRHKKPATHPTRETSTTPLPASVAVAESHES